MSRYLIKKDTDSDKIICIQYDLAGYKFHPKMNENAEINVKEVTVYDKNMIDNVITKKFERNYQKLYLLVYQVLNNPDSTDSDRGRCLTEIDRLASVLKNKYLKFLSYEKNRYFLDRLYELSIMLNRNMISTMYYDEEEEIEESHMKM